MYIYVTLKNTGLYFCEDKIILDSDCMNYVGQGTTPQKFVKSVYLRCFFWWLRKYLLEYSFKISENKLIISFID